MSHHFTYEVQTAALQPQESTNTHTRHLYTHTNSLLVNGALLLFNERFSRSFLHCPPHYPALPLSSPLLCSFVPEILLLSSFTSFDFEPLFRLIVVVFSFNVFEPSSPSISISVFTVFGCLAVSFLLFLYHLLSSQFQHTSCICNGSAQTSTEAMSCAGLAANFSSAKKNLINLFKCGSHHHY